MSAAIAMLLLFGQPAQKPCVLQVQVTSVETHIKMKNGEDRYELGKTEATLEQGAKTTAECKQALEDACKQPPPDETRVKIEARWGGKSAGSCTRGHLPKGAGR
jgi:hypothetical protein